MLAIFGDINEGDRIRFASDSFSRFFGSGGWICDFAILSLEIITILEFVGGLGAHMIIHKAMCRMDGWMDGWMNLPCGEKKKHVGFWHPFPLSRAEIEGHPELSEDLSAAKFTKRQLRGEISKTRCRRRAPCSV
jgi:hypothetical protein